MTTIIVVLLAFIALVVSRKAVAGLLGSARGCLVLLGVLAVLVFAGFVVFA